MIERDVRAADRRRTVIALCAVVVCVALLRASAEPVDGAVVVGCVAGVLLYVFWPRRRRG